MSSGSGRQVGRRNLTEHKIQTTQIPLELIEILGEPRQLFILLIRVAIRKMASVLEQTSSIRGSTAVPTSLLNTLHSPSMLSGLLLGTKTHLRIKALNCRQKTKIFPLSMKTQTALMNSKLEQRKQVVLTTKNKKRINPSPRTSVINNYTQERRANRNWMNRMSSC